MATYMQINGIQGNVTSKGFEHWIACRSTHHTVKRGMLATTTGRARDRSRGVPTFCEMEITKDIDKASPLLFQKFCEGNNIDQIKIATVQTNSDLSAYLEYTLHNVIVSSISRINDNSDEKPIEIIKFNFTKLEEKYTPYDAAHQAQSPVSSGYDLESAQSM